MKSLLSRWLAAALLCAGLTVAPTPAVAGSTKFTCPPYCLDTDDFFCSEVGGCIVYFWLKGCDLGICPAVDVHIQTYDITAKSGLDYRGISSATIELPKGTPAGRISIGIADDGIPEPGETFGVKLLVVGQEEHAVDAIGTIVDR
jgi:hypothetical protein